MKREEGKGKQGIYIQSGGPRQEKIFCAGLAYGNQSAGLAILHRHMRCFLHLPSSPPMPREFTEAAPTLFYQVHWFQYRFRPGRCFQLAPLLATLKRHGTLHTSP